MASPKRPAGRGTPRYTGGIGTAVTSKPGGPMVTLGGSKPRGPVVGSKAQPTRNITVQAKVKMPSPGTRQPSGGGRSKRAI